MYCYYWQRSSSICWFFTSESTQWLLRIVEFWTPVSDIFSQRHLWSATRHHLTVACYRLSTFGRRAFSVAGPTVWNSLPDSLCRWPGAQQQQLQTINDDEPISSLPLSTHSAVEMPYVTALFKSITCSDTDNDIWHLTRQVTMISTDWLHLDMTTDNDSLPRDNY